MLFYIDLDLLEVIETATDQRRVAQREIQRGDNTPFEVRFVRNGIQEALPAGTTLTFCAKADLKFDGPAIILQSAFTLTGAGVTAAYVASVAADTAPLNALLNVDATDTNDLPLIDLMGEFSWQLLTAKPTSARRFRTRVNNDVYRGDETFPSTLPGPDDFVLARAVLYDRAQTFTAPQQALVKNKIGANLNFNVQSYGAKGDGLTNDSVAIQAAINAANASGGGTVYFPSGTYLCIGLLGKSNVRIEGENRYSTTLKASGAGTILCLIGNVQLDVINLPIVFMSDVREIMLDGNNVGTIGLEIAETQFWRVNCVTSKRFTNSGFFFRGAVGGYCTDCSASNNYIGYRFDSAFPSAVYNNNHLPSNLTGLFQCVAIHNSYRGIEYINGCNFVVRDCEIESNGTVGNAASGAIHINAVHRTPGSHGLIMSGGWIEDTKGGFNINFDDPARLMYHSITDVFFYDYENVAGHLIQMGGGPNHLILDRCSAWENSIRRNIHVIGTANRQVIELRSSDFRVTGTSKPPVRTPVIPICHWNMEEASGTAITDVSLSSRNGVIVGAGTRVAGRLAGTLAADLPGTAHIAVSPSEVLRISDKQVTVMGWVKLPSVPGTHGVVAGAGVSGQAYLYALIITPAGVASFSLFNGVANPEAVGATAIPINTWVHLCGVYNGSRLRLYVNGVLDSSIETAISIDAPGPVFTIGIGPLGTMPLSVTVDEIRVYNQAFKRSQILDFATD